MHANSRSLYMTDPQTPALVVVALLKPYRRRVILALIALVLASLAMLGVMALRNLLILIGGLVMLSCSGVTA